MTNRLASLVGFFIKRPIATVVLVAALSRIAIAYWLPESVLWVDGLRYEQVARNLVAGAGFGSLTDNMLSVPTLPIVIAAVYSIVGENYLVLRLVFAAIGVGTCVVTYLFARRVFSEGVALLSAIGLAVYPYAVYLSGLFEYPQSLFVFLVSVFFLCYYRWVDTRESWLLVVSGLSLGLAVLTVPTALIFMAAAPGFFVGGGVRSSLRRVALFAICAALPLALWSTRNYVAYDRVVLVNVAQGFSLWQANNETYWEFGKRGVQPFCGPGYEDESFCVEYRAILSDVDSRGVAEADRVMLIDEITSQKAWEFIFSDPVRSIVLSVRKFTEFWSPFPNAVSVGRHQSGALTLWVSILTYTPLLVLAVVGIVLTRKRWRNLLPMYAYVVLMAAPYCLFLPTTRYRIPLDYVLIVFSAYALSRFSSRSLVIQKWFKRGN